MPNVLIEVRKEYTVEEEIKIINSVHESLIFAFKIMKSDKSIRLINHPPHRFTAPTNLSKPERYTLLSIDLYPGRTGEAKRKFYQDVVEKLGAFGIPEDHILISLKEIDRENWGVAGKAASDIDLGYDLKV